MPSNWKVLFQNSFVWFWMYDLNRCSFGGWAIWDYYHTDPLTLSNGRVPHAMDGGSGLGGGGYAIKAQLTFWSLSAHQTSFARLIFNDQLISEFRCRRFIRKRFQYMIVDRESATEQSASNNRDLDSRLTHWLTDRLTDRLLIYCKNLLQTNNYR